MAQTTENSSLTSTDDNAAKNKDTSKATMILRKVDIVLKGKQDGGERWIELKSLQKYEVKDNVSAIQGDGLKTYGSSAMEKVLNSGLAAKYLSSSYNKQFHVDRVASKGLAYRETGQAGVYSKVVVSEAFAWRFHRFEVTRDKKKKVNPPLGTVTARNRSIRERLTATSVGSHQFSTAAMKETLGIDVNVGETPLDRERYGRYIQLLEAVSEVRRQLSITDNLEAEIEQALAGKVAP